MKCSFCDQPVAYVTTIFKQEYNPNDGAEAGVTKHHICISCMKNLDDNSVGYDDDSSNFLGVPSTK